MLPNYLIQFLDNNNRIRSFYSINNFLKFLEFNSSFPGLFQFETNNMIYRWTVKYNKQHYSFAYIRLFNYETRTISNTITTIDDVNISKQIQSSIYQFPVNPSTSGMSLIDNFWMTPNIDDLNFLRIFQDDFIRDYNDTYIWYISSLNKWFGYDGVNKILYQSTDNLIDVLQAILLDWYTDNSQRLTITEI